MTTRTLRYLATGLAVGALLGVSVAGAHQAVTVSDTVLIDDPDISHAVYGSFDTGDEVFTIQLPFSEPFALPFEILVEHFEGKDDHRPHYAVVGPGLPAPTPEEEALLPKPLPAGAGVFLEKNDAPEREVIFESVMRRTYWSSGPVGLPAAGRRLRDLGLLAARHDRRLRHGVRRRGGLQRLLLHRPDRRMVHLCVLSPAICWAAWPRSSSPRPPRRSAPTPATHAGSRCPASSRRTSSGWRWAHASRCSTGSARPTAGENLRLSWGVLPGPELVHMPLAVGYRQGIALGDVAELGLGLGFELQTFFVPDHYTVVRPAFYAEFLLDFKVMEQGWLGIHTGADVAPFQYFGFGIMTRLGFRWDFK